jgi:hypothetical protein
MATAALALFFAIATALAIASLVDSAIKARRHWRAVRRELAKIRRM